MTYIGQCASCGMRSLESGIDGFGSFSRCHLCGWQEDGESAGVFHASPGAIAGRSVAEVASDVARMRAPAAPLRPRPTGTRTIIAISGQPGAGANEIGLRVASLLGTDHFDRLILERVARRLKATVDAVEGRERRVATRMERLQRFLERAFERGAYSTWAADPYYLPPATALLSGFPDPESAGPRTLAYEIDDREFMQALSTELRLIADQGDSVIVHMAACAALPDSPEILKVGVFAPEETRVNRLLSRNGLIEVERAQHELRERDRARRNLFRRTLRVDPDDASLFDFTISSQALGIEDAADQIVSAIRSRGDRRSGTLVPAAERRIAAAAARPVESTIPADAYVKALASTDIFRALPESQVRELVGLGRVVEYPEGSILAAEEAVGEVVYAVISGQVELSAESEVGRVTVRVAHDGEAFPLAAIIGTGKIITRAEAMTDLKLWRVDREAFRSFLRSRPEVGLPVYDATARIMADRYRQTLSRLTHAAERALSKSRPRVSV